MSDIESEFFKVGTPLNTTITRVETHHDLHLHPHHNSAKNLKKKPTYIRQPPNPNTSTTITHFQSKPIKKQTEGKKKKKKCLKLESIGLWRFATED